MWLPTGTAVAALAALLPQVLATVSPTFTPLHPIQKSACWIHAFCSKRTMLHLTSALYFLNATLQIYPYLQSILKPVESADAIHKRQAGQPFNNDYNGPHFTSPPSYPSPWGSGAGDWASAYEKARAFVSQLTLLEKVNLTTGVG